MCGILAYYYNNKINNDIIQDFLFKLKHLQHRGQDGFGIYYDNQYIIKTGIIQNYINKMINSYINSELNTNCILGHTRYITSGTKNNKIYQPIKGICKFGEFSLIYNGNIEMSKYQYLFDKEFSVDTEMIIEFIETESTKRNSFNDVLINFINLFDRAFSIIICINNELYCLRDKYGVKPLMYFYTLDTLIFSSETCIVNNDNKVFKYKFKEVNHGEILHIKNFVINTIYSSFIKYSARCLFEYIYFMNKNTKWNNIHVDEFRKKLGYLLANYEPNKTIMNNRRNYLVIGIPNTGIISAKEYARQLDLEYYQGIIKNIAVNRTFILKNDLERSNSAKLKYIYDSNIIKNRNIIIIDDSIVRGITIKTIIENLKKYTVNEIHLRIACPKIIDTCNYGIDIPTKEELLLTKYTNSDDLINHLGCTSIEFVDIKRIVEKTNSGKGFCTGCFNGNYKDKNKLLEW
jgi:amidophosphoribosyltransferase